jgi:hypothetical protein
MSDVAQVKTMHRVAGARVCARNLARNWKILATMQKAAWLKGFFHFRCPVHEVATLLRWDFFDARSMRARSHEDGSSQAKFFFTGRPRKRA